LIPFERHLKTLNIFDLVEYSNNDKSTFKITEPNYKAQFDDLFTKLKKEDIIRLVEHVTQKEGSDPSGRTYTAPAVLSYIVTQCSKEIPEDADETKFFSFEAHNELAERLVAELQKKAEDFPTQLMHATRFLSECFEADQEYKQAARTLNAFKFDGYRTVVEASAQDKMRWYVDTARFYLQADDAASASQSIKRAHAFLAEIEKDGQTFLVFKTICARVQDAERNFLGAAREYWRLSQYYGKVPESALLDALKNAVTCAILAAAGPDRTRILSLLYADDRASQLPNFQMLERMLKERVIRAGEVEKFEKLLASHQKATDGDGNTVLSKAIMEHNMRAASKIYHNITFTELGVLLDISALKAEALARKMIEGQQMEGTIDQVEGVIEFEDRTGSLLTWDQQINNTCLQVNDILDNIGKKHPQYEY